MMLMMLVVMVQLQKMAAAGQRQISALHTNPEPPEHVINIIERPSQLALTNATHSTSAAHPPPHPTPGRTASVARRPDAPGPLLQATATGSANHRRPSVNQQLVDHIQQLYQQMHPNPTNDNGPRPANA